MPNFTGPTVFQDFQGPGFFQNSRTSQGPNEPWLLYSSVVSKDLNFKAKNLTSEQVERPKL